MAGRPEKVRRVGLQPEFVEFSPGLVGGTAVERATLTRDELEAIRLIDLEGLDQAAAAQRMGVGRATVAGICRAARRKVADALVNGKLLVVSGGSVRYAPGRTRPSATWPGKEREEDVRIAVTYEGGQVFPHFGRTEHFKLYDVEDGKVISSQVVDSNGVGHGALAGLLAGAGVDVLVCGGVGGGALGALSNAGIRVYAGASGDTDAVVEALLSGALTESASATCGCGGHEHAEGGCCGGHGHAEGGCGCGGHGHAEGGCCGHHGGC